MCWSLRLLLSTLILVVSVQAGQDCAEIELPAPTVEQISFEYFDKEEDTVAKVRVYWDLPELGDCQVSKVSIVRKIIQLGPRTRLAPKISNSQKETTSQPKSGGVATLEAGPDVQAHIIWYSLIMRSPGGDSVMASSPSVRFEPTRCSGYPGNLNFTEPLRVNQVSPGTVNITWGGLDGSHLKCTKYLRVNYVKDPLNKYKKPFYGGYKTIFVMNPLVLGESAGSCLVNIPLDTFMMFRLSAGIDQGDEAVWFDGPTEVFKSNEKNGCGSLFMSQSDESDMVWLPDFEGEDLDEGLKISMDEYGENVVADWSVLNITNRDCLNGFVLEYHWKCETCDDFGKGSILVPPNKQRLELHLEDKRFEGKREYKRGHGFVQLPVKGRYILVKVRTTWRLEEDARGKAASAKFLIDPEVDSNLDSEEPHNDDRGFQAYSKK